MGRHDAPAVCPRCLPPPSFPSPFSFSGSHIYCLGDSAKPPFDPSCVCSLFLITANHRSPDGAAAGQRVLDDAVDNSVSVMPGSAPAPAPVCLCGSS